MPRICSTQKTSRCVGLIATSVFFLVTQAGCSNEPEIGGGLPAWPIDPAVYDSCSGVIPTDAKSEPGPVSDVVTPLTTAQQIGQPHPEWSLLDQQSASCGFDQVYGLSEFRERVVVLALLASW